MMAPLGTAGHTLLAASTAPPVSTRTMPSFVSAGMAIVQNLQANDLSVPVTGAAGDYVLLLVNNRNTAGTVDNVAAIQGLGWELLVNGDTVGSNSRLWTFGKFHDGAEPDVTVAWSGTNLSCGQTFAYADVDPADPIDVVATSTGGTGVTAIPMPTVGPTSVANCLAVALVAGGPNPAVAASAGETGGDWLESVAEFITTVGVDAVIQAQHAGLAAAGATISGGTSSTGATSSNITVVGFALKGAPA